MLAQDATKHTPSLTQLSIVFPIGILREFKYRTSPLSLRETTQDSRRRCEKMAVCGKQLTPKTCLGVVYDPTWVPDCKSK